MRSSNQVCRRVLASVDVEETRKSLLDTVARTREHFKNGSKE